MSPILQYQKTQAEAKQPELERYQAAMDAWNAEREGLLAAIREASKKGSAASNSKLAGRRDELAPLQSQKPQPPRIPRLLYADVTPEALAYGLAKHWPTAGMISAEGGTVFGAHGMRPDNILRNLSILNQLWDGTHYLPIDRRASESFAVKGARLTLGLQVQESPLRRFLDQSGRMARGTGFLARFLLSWPESTQGFRPFTESPTHWPHLDSLHYRLATLLDQPLSLDSDGTLNPPLLTLTPPAKRAWVEYHDAIEAELRSGGELYDVRDVASKSADNAVRLAVLFQVFEHGLGAIDLEAFEGASRIAAWHLHESRRFFGELALPAELAAAARLDSWLIAYCQRERTDVVPIAKLQQGGPSSLRSKVAIETAMQELEEKERARWIRDGKRKMIAVDPALLGLATEGKST